MDAPQPYRFGPFRLDPAAFRLDRGAAEVPLTPKAFELLSRLIRERHRVLTKQELLDTLWPDTAVTENTLTQRVKEIRQALGDSAQSPMYIRTIPRVGFQFVGAVTVDTAPARATDIGPERLVPAAVDPPEPFDRAAQSPQRALPGWSTRLAAALAVGVLVAVALLWRVWREPSVSQSETTGRIMLAVLPFENLSGDSEQEYLSDGLTEELIAEFGRLDPGRLGVIARTSAMTYKRTTKTIGDIARELGVAYIVEGSVRRERDRVRIVAQLIRASDQTHTWADQYDRDMTSVLSLQSEVARAIAAETRVNLSAATAAPGVGVTAHPGANEAYLKGRFFLNQRTREAIEKALQQFQQAIAADPPSAHAHAGLADAYDLLASYSTVAPHHAFERGMAAARRAIELDGQLSEPYASLGTFHASYTWDWAEAENAYRRALALNWSNAAAHKGYSDLLSFVGRHEEALGEAQHAVATDPVSLVMQANLGIINWRARRYDEAMRQMRQTLSMDPNYMLGHLNVGLIYAAQGSYDEAVTAFRRASQYSPGFADALGLLGYAYARAGNAADARAIGLELEKLSRDTYVPGYIRALYHLGLGERDQALVHLQRAYDDRSWLVAMLKVDPLLDDLRSDSRFQTLLQRLRFPD